MVLQMGYIESRPYFCVASEMACNIAVDCIEIHIGSLPDHKFVGHSTQGKDFTACIEHGSDNVGNDGFDYLVEMFVDNYVGLIITTSTE